MFGRNMNDALGQDPLLGHDHPLQLHLHPAVPHRHRSATTAASTTTRTSRSWRRRRCRTCASWRRSSLLVMLAFQFDLPLQLHQQHVLGPKPAPKNPWKANTLEWTAASPPPHGNWPRAADRVPRPVRVQRTRTAPTTTGRRTRRAEQSRRATNVRIGPTDRHDPQRRRDAHRPARRVVGDRVRNRDLRRPARRRTSCTASAHPEWAQQAAHTNTWPARSTRSCC